MIDYVEMKGISYRHHIDEDGNFASVFEDDVDDIEEQAVRQVFDDLNVAWPSSSEPAKPVDPPAPPPTVPPPAPTTSSLVELPELDDVSLTLVETKGTMIEPRQPGRRAGGSSSGWLPPTPAEGARASLLGQRGEALFYRQEIAEVRAMGYPEPERYVICTSRDQPGADHDIRSIDADGRPRWLEVKSTTGSDGRFEWRVRNSSGRSASANATSSGASIAYRAQSSRQMLPEPG